MGFDVTTWTKQSEKHIECLCIDGFFNYFLMGVIESLKVMQRQASSYDSRKKA